MPLVTRYASKVDNTHREVVDALRAYGWLVKDTHKCGDFVDAVGYGAPHRRDRSIYLIEIKSSAKAKYTEGQQDMIRDGWPILTLCSAEDVRKLMEGE